MSTLHLATIFAFNKSFLTVIFEALGETFSKNWIKLTLFCASSHTMRQLMCNLMQTLYTFSTSLTQIQPNATATRKKFQIGDLLVAYLDEIVTVQKTELTQDYLGLLKLLISTDRELKYYLVLKKRILFRLESLLDSQSNQINDEGESLETARAGRPVLPFLFGT